MAQAQALALNNDLLLRNRRMVFAAGTTPDQRVSAMHAGDTLEVLGIPRINLALVLGASGRRHLGPRCWIGICPMRSSCLVSTSR